MLKNKTKIISIFLTIILLFSATFVFADNEVSDNAVASNSTNTESTQVEDAINSQTTNAELQEDSYKKSDVYLTGDNVTIDYIVDGNLFVCANTVTINSQIGGDAFIMAKNLIIEKEGYVFSNLFSMADSIEVKGVIYDIYALTENLTISGGYVYRDIKVSCNNLNINGTVGRNVFTSCGNINFNTDQSTNGAIYGNLNYTSKSEISIPENVVTGEVKYSQSFNSSEISIQSTIATYILDLGHFLTFVLIIWLVCLWLAPKFLDNTNSFVGKKTLKVCGFGLLTAVMVPIACIILILLQLTSGVSLLLLALYLLAIGISKSLFTITANNYICSKFKISKNSGIFGMLILSGFIIWLLTQIPYVGIAVSFIITILGLGILICSIIPNKNKIKKISETNKDSNK
ncbi:MAG: hypothetical protein IJE05_03655 [Clostridia bacterium]|nr:hypothetical protein [Clostridia bacterium]